MDLLNWLYLACQTILCTLICARLFPPFHQYWTYISGKVARKIQFPVEKYEEAQLSPITARVLRCFKRKILVLDMDETLMTSLATRDNYRASLRLQASDFKLVIGRATYLIFKRPFVDYFLDTVNNWYDIVIYTAATPAYANLVLDRMDKGRGILSHRLYRQHCVLIRGMRAKFMGIVNKDLSRVLIIDNSDVSCGFNPDNSIRIRSFRHSSTQSRDNSLLKLLPFLDALRFVSDVRCILGRNKRTQRFHKSCWP